MATIALDIGGTKIASAIFLSDGSMMFNRKRLLKGRTGHEVGKLAADILAKLLTVARKSRIQIDGVGVCIPGIVYSQTNRVWAPNIPGWDNYPLYEELRCVTPPEVDIYIDSDRTCYMYGEMWQGAAKNCHSAVFIAVGTGIGAGIIIDGHVLHGASDIIGATGWKVIWGGGVFGPAGIFIDDIYKEACKWAQPISIRQAEFVPSQLSGNAGLTGAAFLAIKNHLYE